MNCLRQFQFLSLPVPSSLHNQPWPSAARFPLQPFQHARTGGSREIGKTMRTQATLNSCLDSLVLGVATAKRGDISVLLPTGGVMLFMYVIANFVFPHFLMKYYESEAATEDNDDIFPDKDGKDSPLS